MLLLVAVAVIGVTAAASVSLGARIARRDAEAQLLDIGREFEQALISYRSVAMGAQDQGPRNLEDLLRDPRRPATTRHLRQIYADPLTGQPQWGLVRAPGGAIVGVFSLAEGVPIKQAGFDAAHSGFADAHAYAGWVFQAPIVSALPPPLPANGARGSP
jgi:type II secretory pathway pseudopilin PulG